MMKLDGVLPDRNAAGRGARVFHGGSVFSGYTRTRGILPPFCLHGKARHPADLALAGLRRLVLRVASVRRSLVAVLSGCCLSLVLCCPPRGEVPPLAREPAYADKRSQDGEAPSASE